MCNNNSSRSDDCAKKMREKDSKCALFVYFLCMCALKRCKYVQSLSTGWQKNAKKKGKMERKGTGRPV